MQGNLSEIDIRSILQLIELGQRTGELFVESYSSSVNNNVAEPQHHFPTEPSWFVFFLNGKIIYATQSAGSLSRLRDYLRRYKADQEIDNIKVPSFASVHAPEYGYLWAFLEKGILTPAQGRGIIHNMVRETLFNLLSLRRGSFIFDLSPALTPQLTTFEISSLLAKIIKQIQEWNQFSPYIHSAEQCPVIADPAQLQKALQPHIYNRLKNWSDGQTSMQQIARYLNRDVLTVAKAIYPFVQKGIVQLIDQSSETSTIKKPKPLQRETKIQKVVCIDDDVIIREKVELILNQNGYKATSLSDPLKALGEVFLMKPDLILCDIAMPELDGYEICAMLRNSTAFRQTPIIMLTGIEGFIDRVKARIVGATHYLTKPFGESELLMLVEQYIGPGIAINYQVDKTFSKFQNT
ncbi:MULTISPECIES: response regulator [unclassified Okeania]|uniref:response regulator n=1 Tax=unclassified Okeania TaxID=2634635 RepID=UPI0013B7EFB5|nr:MULTISPECIES: response regulator [unclassified Okeania]NEP06543.1 response regulator [Okeania sp. SIO4D6]NET12026.1 response regulator [Okeania sp. SIO1H6]NEP71865.1 response regulator [Okeania sp. SIO2G5]NEP92885.1 response regulator [Okeania sp. SIO2F5]NEQ90961.1 response regulator [Okeania sp. SIO2G4]